MRLAGCFLSVFLATIFVGLAPEANLIWVANGVMLAYLLLTARYKWPAYLCAGYVAQLTGGLLVGHHGIVSAMVLTLLNLCESLLSAFLLRRRSARLPDFTNPRYVTRFIAFGVIAGPVLMGAIDASLSPLWHQATPGAEFLEWVASDALGACVATPVFVTIYRARFRRSLYSLKHWAHLVLIVVCSAFVFSQAHLPVLFLLYPLLVVVLLRLGLGWAGLASLLVAAIGSSFTVHGLGPFAVSASTTPLQSAILLQLFLASAMVILYSVSVVVESQKDTERQLRKIATLHALITENSRDAIILADLKGNRRYVSSASESIGGWKPEELMKQGNLDLIHPEDKPRAEAAVKSLGSVCESASMEIRIRNSNGDYIWVDSSLRVARDPKTGAPYGILNIVRDITQRRRAEQAREFHDSLMRAIHEVTQDGILVVDNHENIAAINRKFSDVWRVAESDLPAGAYDQTTALSDQVSSLFRRGPL